MNKQLIALPDGHGRRYLTVAEFGEVIGRSPYTLQRWRSEGSGPPYIKVGGRVSYDMERVHEWIASHEQTSTSSETVSREQDEKDVDPKPSKPRHKWDMSKGRFIPDSDHGSQ